MLIRTQADRTAGLQQQHYRRSAVSIKLTASHGPALTQAPTSSLPGGKRDNRAAAEAVVLLGPSVWTGLVFFRGVDRPHKAPPAHCAILSSRPASAGFRWRLRSLQGPSEI
ncbi:hypothetical protein FQA47_019657 [Oryzias melastigma]|uniref:Uncharacterized protein n=1 Tax=Oryzias melastigma TaxID=30732 RepID=A0A834FND0_ORYME|nr:hypothetical protein FQA47_019657 [Oryzias melastigma]